MSSASPITDSSAHPQSEAPDSSGVPLRQAPEHFFDRAKWREYVTYFESADAPLQHLGRLEPGIIVFYRREVAQLPGVKGEQARRAERAAELDRLLVADFKKRLINGELATTGFSPLAVDQVSIPGPRWSDLQPNFMDNSAEGGGLKFTGIRVFAATHKPASPAPMDRCLEWMQRRAREGESRRKILLGEGLKQFGNELKIRTFDAAYKKVFSKRRGRPRKTSVE